MKNKNVIIAITLSVLLLAGLTFWYEESGQELKKGDNSIEKVEVTDVVVSQNDEVVATTTLETVTNSPAEEVVTDVETNVTPEVITTKPKPVVTQPEPVVIEDPAPEPVKPSGITMAEVRTHADASSCWSAINGAVYDLTAYIPKHPGGKGEILAICGKDGSSAFDGQHGGDAKPERILASYKIDDLSN